MTGLSLIPVFPCSKPWKKQTVNGNWNWMDVEKRSWIKKKFYPNWMITYSGKRLKDSMYSFWKEDIFFHKVGCMAHYSTTLQQESCVRIQLCQWGNLRELTSSLCASFLIYKIEESMPVMWVYYKHQINMDLTALYKPWGDYYRIVRTSRNHTFRFSLKNYVMDVAIKTLQCFSLTNTNLLSGKPMVLNLGYIPGELLKENKTNIKKEYAGPTSQNWFKWLGWGTGIFLKLHRWS